MHLIRHGEELLEQLNKNILRGIHALIVFMAEHLDARIDEEGTKDTQYPVKALHHRRSRKDKDAPKDQGSKDTPE